MNTGRTVAVTGAASPLGQAITGQLVRAPGARVVGIDVTVPQLPQPGMEFRTMDVRDHLLHLALEGADAVVHCAFDDEPRQPVGALYGVNVGGVTNLLDALDKCGVGQLVLLSSAAVYGAHADNAIPLREDAPRRANPEHVTAHQRLLVEEAVEDWAEQHRDATVAVLRCAPVQGGAVRDALTAVLAGAVLPTITGHRSPWQLVHVEDVATAVQVVLDSRAGGAFNVAAEGWLPVEEVTRALGSVAVDVPAASARGAAAVLHRMGLWPLPGSAVPYLAHPWVVETRRLQALGWRPTRSSTDVLREIAFAHEGTVGVGTVRVRTRHLALAARLVAGVLTVTMVRALAGGPPRGSR